MRLITTIALSCLATSEGFVGVVSPVKQTQQGGGLNRVMMVLKNPNNYEGSTVSADASSTISTDQWIQAGIESQAKGEVVIGPDHVLVYDTTLRGKQIGTGGMTCHVSFTQGRLISAPNLQQLQYMPPSPLQHLLTPHIYS